MPEYDVFLSHNSADQEAVEIIARRLREEAGLEPFLDRWHLVPGEPWQEAIEEALEQSATVAVFIGPSGVSPWHNEEMRAGLDRAVRGRDDVRIIPVLLPDSDPGALPLFLSGRTYVDFRPGLDDADAFDRLAAGILGQPPERVDPFTLPDEPAPYPGLLPFTAEQTDFFFGRTDERDRLLGRVHESPFVVVVGASGSGKSSLVLAGLLPALDNGWQALTLVPGARPLRALADQLATLGPPEGRLRLADDLESRLGERNDGLSKAVSTLLADRPKVATLLILVDQFEELFTHVTGTPEEVRQQQHRFITNLVDTARTSGGRVRVTLTLRADFVRHCLGFPDLRSLLEPNQLLLGPMGEDALREAIVKPAQTVGAMFEKGLVGRLMDDMRDQPSVLPLLSFTLAQLWQRRHGVWLTHAAYEEIGGVSGAIDQRADAVFQRMSETQQQIARNLFVRLVALGEGASDTRRRVNRSELSLVGVTTREVEELIGILSHRDVRLIVADVDTVELAHEALIEQWGQLSEWLDKDRAALRTHRRLTEAAKEWEDNDRDVSYLYHGARLAEAEEWAEVYSTEMSAPEKAFLIASTGRREAEQRAARQRLQRLVGGLVGVLVVISILAGTAVVKWRDSDTARATAQAESKRAIRAEGTAVAEATHAINAERTARDERATAEAESTRAVNAEATADARRVEAEEQRRIALSRQLAIQASDYLDNRLDLALLLSLEGKRLADTAEVRNSLHNSLTWCSPHLTTILGHHGVPLGPGGLAVSPNGRKLVIIGNYGFVVNPDGETSQYEYDESRHPILWDMMARPPHAQSLAGHRRYLYALAFSPDGKILATGGCGFSGPARNGYSNASISGEILLWDVASYLPIGSLIGHTGPVVTVAFSPDGKMLASGSASGTIILWDVTTKQPVGKPLVGHAGLVLDVTFDPTGRKLASGGLDNTVIMWDVANQKAIGEPMLGHTGRVWSLDFSPDGKMLATGSMDETIILWDVATNQRVGDPLTSHSDRVSEVVFSPDGQVLASASADKTIALWNVATLQPIGQPLTGHTAGVHNMTFVQDGQTLISGDYNGAIVLWDLGMPRTFTGHTTRVEEMAFNIDGRILASGGEDQTILLWDVASGQLMGEIKAESVPMSLAISPDGQLLASAHDDKSIILWDVATGKPRGQPLSAHATYVESLAFSPDGQILASGSSGIITESEGIRFESSSEIILWNVATGQPVDVTTRDFPSYFFARQHMVGTGSLAFSPDGQTLASSAEDIITLWDVATAQPIDLPFEGGNFVHSLAFSPDGQTLAAGDEEAKIILWDVKAREMEDIEHLTSYAGDVKSVAFTPDGQILASGSGGPEVFLWQVKPESQQARACRIAGRNLTQEEWTEYLGEEPYHETCPDLLPAQPIVTATRPFLLLEPFAGPVGTKHEIKFGAFGAGEEVNVIISFEETGKAVFTTSLFMDEAGNGSFNVFSEPGDANGRYLVTAEGADGSVVEGTLEIVSADPRLIIEPPYGPVGTKYAISLLYFEPGEVVDLKIAFAETGETILSTSLTVAEMAHSSDLINSVGSSAYYVTSEPGDASGLYLVIAQGQDGSTARGQFEINDE